LVLRVAVCPGMAFPGEFRQAWYGEVVTGEVRYGEVRQARLGMVRRGEVGCGMAM
jgi:hypothetical protein